MINFDNLAENVRNAVERYKAPQSPGVRFGSTPEEIWVFEQIELMRSALVAPYSSETRDDANIRRTVVIVADDREGSVVVYDPTEDGDFALALAGGPDLVLAGPRGDAVGCFLAR